jgi:hypothetical protein
VAAVAVCGGASGKLGKHRERQRFESFGMTCHRTFIQRQLESRGVLRRLARLEQRAIGGAGRGCAAERPLR